MFQLMKYLYNNYSINSLEARKSTITFYKLTHLNVVQKRNHLKSKNLLNIKIFKFDALYKSFITNTSKRHKNL